jgi:uncharacterized membrane protein
MASTRSFMSGVAVGAGLVYFLDPERGQLRRDRFQRRVAPLLEQARGTFNAGATQSESASLSRYGSRVGDIQGLEAASLSGGIGRPDGPPVALRLAGALLTLYGLTRKGMFGAMIRTLGTGMLVDSARDALTGTAAPVHDRRRAVDIQKTLYIEAPVEQVYGFWSNYENFPLFMSHVREVEDRGQGRSHWKVSGPGGVPIEWNAVLSQQTPNEVIAWRSETGSMLENSGIIRFSPAGSGTRVDLRFCYHPPAGGAGQAVVELLGSDPRAKLNEDLGRMKALLEATARSESHGKESRS